MRKSLIALSLISILTVSAFAQKEKNESETVEATNTKVKKDAPSSKDNKAKTKSGLQVGTSLEAQLQKTLDVKDAKVGDEVMLKVTKDIRQNGEIIVPKGAKLIGRITEIQQKTKQNSMSKLGIVFERLEGKNLNAPINATIISITNVASNTQVGDVFSSETSASSGSTGTVSRRGSGGNGGGLLGGVTNTVGSVINTTTNTVGSVANTTGQTVGSAVSGIKISNSTSASVNGSTTLSAENRNLRIEKGTNFHLKVNSSVERQ
jgi:hypothetical protein